MRAHIIYMRTDNLNMSSPAAALPKNAIVRERKQ